MNTKEAYKTIAKHIFVAYRVRTENPLEIIVMAESKDDAQRIANNYFGVPEDSGNTFVMVHELTKTEKDNVFFIG